MAYEYVPYNGLVIKQRDAKAHGLDRYFTGKACKHGHLSQRRTSNGSCIPCSAIYAENLLATEGDRLRAYSAAYRSANKEREIARAMAWRAANRDRFDANARAWLDANKEHVAGLRAAWAKANAPRRKATNKIWADANRDKIKAQRKALSEKHPLRARCYVEKRRALKLASGGTYTPEQIKALGVSQRHKCPNCKVSIKAGYEIDHIVALSKGGSNDIRNIQLLCKPCNRSKHTKDPILWAQENGRLL